MQKKGKRKKEKRKKNRIILRGCSRAAIDRSYGGRINFPYIEPLHSTSTGKTGGGGGGGAVPFVALHTSGDIRC
jgi:hypothetical protein